MLQRVAAEFIQYYHDVIFDYANMTVLQAK